MDTCVEISKQQKLTVLRCLYLNSFFLSESHLGYINENTELVVMDCDAKVVAKLNSTKYKIYKSFIIIQGLFDKDSVALVNTCTNSFKKFDSRDLNNIYNPFRLFKLLGDNYITYYNYDTHDFLVYILDSNLNKILTLNASRPDFFVENENSDIIRISNKDAYIIKDGYVITIDKNTNNVLCYDNLYIKSKNLKLMSLRRRNNKNKSCINRENNYYLRYHLVSDKDEILSAKDYLDIYCTPDMVGTQYLYCLDSKTIESNYLGILDRQGNELLSPIATDIIIISKNCFKVTIDGKQYIFNADTRKFIMSEYNITNVYKHNTLPINIIYTGENKYFILDYKDNLYNFEDITKNFDCYISEKYPNIVKFVINSKLGSTNTYVTSNLSPITNIKLISEYNNSIYNGVTWNKI